jgi:hypothetical protein
VLHVAAPKPWKDAMHRALLVSALLLAATPVRADEPSCEQLGPESGLPALSAALEAYAQLDPELFSTTMILAEQGLACLERPLTTEEQTQLWLARGLDGWLRRDKPALVAAFAELVALDPEVDPGPEIIPPGSALDKALTAAHGSAVTPAPAPEPEPAVVPTVAVPSPLADAIEPAPQRRPSWALLGSGLAVGAVAGASILVSQRAEDRFWAADLRSDADAAYTTNRAAGFTAYGAAGISASLVVGAVVVGRW